MEPEWRAGVARKVKSWSADEYALQITRFAEAMRAVDPSIQLVGCGVGEVNGWNRDVTAGAGVGDAGLYARGDRGTTGDAIPDDR